MLTEANAAKGEDALGDVMMSHNVPMVTLVMMPVIKFSFESGTAKP